MTLDFTKEEWDKLPFRSDIKYDYVVGNSYRDKYWTNLVFQFIGPTYRPSWWTFQASVRS
jgi:hypothetical protein